MRNDCPFSSFNVACYKGLINVTFVLSRSVDTTDIAWLNTHLVDGMWFITAEEDTIKIVVKFYEEDK